MEQQAMEKLIRDHLNEAAELHGWPRHVESKEDAEKLVRQWLKFVQAQQYSDEEFITRFQKAMWTSRFFPTPADVANLQLGVFDLPANEWGIRDFR